MHAQAFLFLPKKREANCTLVTYVVYRACFIFRIRTGFFLGGVSAPPPLRILCPPLEIPPKNCFRVNVLAFCSYLLQIPIRVILTCQVSFQIALDAIKGSYTKEEGMQLDGNHVDGEILSVTKNKNAFTEL